MTKRLFAEGTDVPVSRSKAEIETLVTRYGAYEFGSATRPGRATIGFAMHDRKIRFDLLLPDVNDERFAPTRTRGRSRQDLFDAECRRLWRCLALMVKAKMEACESGIVTFDDEFMAHIVTPSGQTVSERFSPQLLALHDTHKAAPLLIGGSVQ